MQRRKKRFLLRMWTFELGVDVYFLCVSTIVFVCTLTHMLQAIETANASYNNCTEEHWLCFLHNEIHLHLFSSLFSYFSSIHFTILFVLPFFFQFYIYFEFITYSFIVYCVTARKNTSERKWNNSLYCDIWFQTSYGIYTCVCLCVWVLSVHLKSMPLVLPNRELLLHCHSLCTCYTHIYMMFGAGYAHINRSNLFVWEIQLTILTLHIRFVFSLLLFLPNKVVVIKNTLNRHLHVCLRCLHIHLVC